MRSRTCSSSWTAGRKMTPGILFPALLDQFCDEACPAGLVARADARAVVAVKILVEEEQILPVRIALEKFGAAGDRAAAVLAAHENMNEAAGNLGGDFPEVRFTARARREFDFEVLTVIVMVFLQGFDQEIVHREPDRSTPVGIAAKNAAGGFGGLVIDAADVAIDLDFGRVIEVIAGKRANTIGRKEFGFGEHAGEDALQLFAVC